MMCTSLIFPWNQRDSHFSIRYDDHMYRGVGAIVTVRYFYNHMAGSGMAYMSVTPPGSMLTFSFRKLDLVLPVRVETPSPCVVRDFN